MEKQSDQFQRRALLGQQHLILAAPEVTNQWAVPGTVVVCTDAKGVREFGVVKTVSTEWLRAYARVKKLPFEVVDKYPVYRAQSNMSSALD